MLNFFIGVLVGGGIVFEIFRRFHNYQIRKANLHFAVMVGHKDYWMNKYSALKEKYESDTDSTITSSL